MSSESDSDQHAQEGSGSPSGFVFVTDPLPSVTRFVDWVEKQNLPKAEEILHGKKLAADEVQLFVNRSSFLRDLLRPFSSSGSSCVVDLLNDDTWTKIWRQFAVDLPREKFVVNGKPSEDPDVAYALIEKLIRELPQEMISRGAKSDLHAMNEAKAETPVGSSSWLSMVLFPLSYLNSAPSSAASSVILSEEMIERFIRFVILMSQQSVLAVPFELIMLQYMKQDGHEQQLHVGERRRNTENETQMRIELTVNNNMLHLCVLKPFRVFAIVNGGDLTLFGVDAKMDIDLLGAMSDPVEINWKLVELVEKTEAPRQCQCLGASSGYHQDTCRIQK